MKNSIIHYIVLVFIVTSLASYTQLRAQDIPTAPGLKKYTLAVQPFYLANLGLRLDFEKRIGKTNQWLQIGPTGYFSTSSSPSYNNSYKTYELLGATERDINRLLGGGLNVGYKKFFSSDLLYWQAGVSYTHYSVKYPSREWVSFIEDEMTFHEYKELELRQKFNKVGANLLLGMQSSTQYVFLDAYVGIGYSYSFYDANKAHFNDTMYGFGHRGLLFVAGLRFGLGFGKTK